MIYPSDQPTTLEGWRNRCLATAARIEAAVKAEREACATACEALIHAAHYQAMHREPLTRAANAIRKRGE